jgi:hypothetical protein
MEDCELSTTPLMMAQEVPKHMEGQKTLKQCSAFVGMK